MFDNRQEATETADHRIDAGLDSERAIYFGSFQLFPAQRLLLEGRKPLCVGSRALDILIALVERPGELVRKEELMARVWPNTFVGPANLAVHIGALRRILRDGRDGNRFLINIPGRGYRFVTPIRVTDKSTPLPPRSIEQMHSLHAQLTRVSDRGPAVVELSSEHSRDRFLALVGHDGNAKTSVASAVAEDLIANYQHGIRLIETFLRQAG